MVSYLKIILIGLGIMVLLIGGIVTVGYFWAKANGRLAQHPGQKPKEDVSYEAFAGGFDNDEPASVDFSSEKGSDEEKDDEFSFEFDSDSEDDVDTVSFD